jgi:hypothetical protein
VNTSRLAGQADVVDAPASFKLFTTPQYEAIVADRDSRFVDSDADGITDVKEAELKTDEAEETVFYLAEAYDAIVADRDSRFVDTDADGITDVKEAELGSDTSEDTIFFLKEAYDFAINASRLAGQADVTEAPDTFALFTTPQYNAIVAEKDARFVDTDADGITDVKEAELQTNTTEATVFYLQEALDFEVNTSRLAGQADVTDAPDTFALFTTPQYNAVVADRDSRFVDTDADGITDVKEAELDSDAAEADVFYLKDAYDFANVQSVIAGQNEVVAAPGSFGLITDAQYNAVVADRDSRFVDTDADGITDVKEVELGSDAAEADVFYLQDAYDFANAQSVLAGQNDVVAAPGSFGLITDAQYNAVVADRDSRFVDTDADGITDIKEVELFSNPDVATTYYLKDAYDFAISNARTAGRNDVTSNPQGFELTTVAAYNNILAQRDARPTQAQYNAVIADRDARPTIDEIKDARLGSVLLQPDGANNNVKIRFSIEETDDFRTWTKRDGINEVIVPLEAGSKFYRFALEDK